MGEGSSKFTTFIAIGVLIVSVSFMVRGQDDRAEERATNNKSHAAIAPIDHLSMFEPREFEDDDVVLTPDERAEAAMWEVPKGVKVVSQMRNSLYMLAGPGHDLAPPPGAAKAQKKQAQQKHNGRRTGLAVSR